MPLWTSLRSLAAAVALCGVRLAGQPKPDVRGPENLTPAEARSCSAATLELRVPRQPPVFHLGERIEAWLEFHGNGQRGYVALPEPRRGHSVQIFRAEPADGATDPSDLDQRVRVGSAGGGWWEGTSASRTLDVNQWLRFRRPGRYLLRVALRRIALPGSLASSPILHCQIESNAARIEILASDDRWEAAELARIEALAQPPSEPDRLRAAAALAYLDTAGSAAALARWYLREPAEPLNSEIETAIFETRWATVVESELAGAYRARKRLPERIARTLAHLEVRRRFGDGPARQDVNASREYWETLRALSDKYAGK